MDGKGVQCWLRAVLPCASMNALENGTACPDITPEELQLLKDALWNTDWSINAEPNLIGLPTNKVHKDKSGKGTDSLPSHNLDHWGSKSYNDEAVAWLVDNIIGKYRKSGDKHDVTVSSIKKNLTTGSDTFRKRIVKRGKRGKKPGGYTGTEDCYAHRLEDDVKPYWFKPFSMADDPSPRNPGKSKKDLVGIFKKI